VVLLWRASASLEACAFSSERGCVDEPQQNMLVVCVGILEASDLSEHKAKSQTVYIRCGRKQHTQHQHQKSMSEGDSRREETRRGGLGRSAYSRSYPARHPGFETQA
jgi:hypothetical protein